MVLFFFFKGTRFLILTLLERRGQEPSGRISHITTMLISVETSLEVGAQGIARHHSFLFPFSAEEAKPIYPAMPHLWAIWGKKGLTGSFVCEAFTLNKSTLLLIIPLHQPFKYFG